MPSVVRAARAALVVIALAVGAVAPAAAAPAASDQDDASMLTLEPILFVGDSLCVGARDHGGGLTGALHSAGWEPEYVCGSGEGLPWGIEQVRDLESVPADVVVALGTNPSPREPEFAGLLVDLRAELVDRGARRIMWVDFASLRNTYYDKSAVLREFTTRHGDGLVRWSAFVEDDWFRSDGLHYGDLGMRQWSRRIADDSARLRNGAVRDLGGVLEGVTRSVTPSRGYG